MYDVSNQNVYKRDSNEASWPLFSVFNHIFRHSIVASIPACHAGDRGSIPRDGISRCAFACLAQLVRALH